MEKATVIIPNYNGMKYIRGCLDSLVREKGQQPDFGILVVDNGSTDGSCQVVAEEYPQAELLRLDENTGFCHAVNVGIRGARSEYVILLNNDTIVKPGFIKNLVAAADGDPRIFSVSALMLMWDRPDLVDDAGDRYCALGWAYSRGKGRTARGYGQPAEIFAACGGAALYRRELFAEIGYFDESHFAYLEDIDIGYRALIHGYRNVYEPGARVLHAGSASSGSRYNEFKTRLASANSVYLIGKNMPIFQLLVNLPFLLIGFLVKTVFFISKKMGKLYVTGLAEGLARCFSREGRRRKVAFRPERLGSYLKIQWYLYADMVRLLWKR